MHLRKIITHLLTWITAFQLLNTSIWNENYNTNAWRRMSSADPTETLVELIVEWHLGQVSAFTLGTHAPDTRVMPKMDMSKVCQPAGFRLACKSASRFVLFIPLDSSSLQAGYISPLYQPPKAA